MKRLELVYVRHNRGGKAPVIPRSTISYYDLTVILDGRLEYIIDGKNVNVESGDMIFIPSGSVRERRESEEKANYISFNFKTSEEYNIPLTLKNVVRSEIILLIDAFDKIEKHAYPDNKEKFENICGCIMAIIEDISAAAQYTPLTRKIMEYIHSDVSRRITLDDIGKLTFFSPIYCDTMFRRETGRSIIDYVIDRRIDEAKRLLLEGTVPLAAIAESVGFSEYNYFSRVFKKRSGYSPTVYRRIALSEMKNQDGVL